MHREDLKAIAPAWSAFTCAVRNDPDAWNLTGDASIKTPVCTAKPSRPPPCSQPCCPVGQFSRLDPALAAGTETISIACMQAFTECQTKLQLKTLPHFKGLQWADATLHAPIAHDPSGLPRAGHAQVSATPALLAQGGKTWISEMYGYLFAAANSSVWHRQLDYSANLVPGVGPIGARHACMLMQQGQHGRRCMRLHMGARCMAERSTCMGEGP